MAADNYVAAGEGEATEAAMTEVGAALENFPARKRKKKFWFHVGKILRTKLSEQAKPHPIPSPHYNSPKPTRPLHPKSTPVILLSPIAGARLRFWQCSGRGISLVRATAKPKS